MFRNVVVVALLATATSPAFAETQTAAAVNVASARTALSKCLGALIRDSLAQHVSTDDFTAKSGAGCKAEEDAYKALSVAADVRDHIARTAAEKNANDDVSDMRANQLNRYKMFVESKMAPA